MIQVEQIKNYFPPYLRESQAHQKYLVKEYIQLLILDYLATTTHIRKIVFIGGTNLRLIKGTVSRKILILIAKDLHGKNLRI